MSRKFMDWIPSVKCVCPSCFEEIDLSKCRVMSGITTGKVLEGPSKGISGRIRIKRLDRNYVLEKARRECPLCRYLLPYNIELVPSITLVVVGDTFSGKSHYIAALIHQIEKTGFTGFNCLTPDIKDMYTQNYFIPLFDQRRIIDPNQPAVDKNAKPLIYKLTVSPSPRHPVTTINLMIYDTAGEDYVRDSRLVQYARFVLNTSAFIFVADPFTMEPIFDKLNPTIQNVLRAQFNLAQRTKAVAWLNSVIDVFKTFHGLPEGSRLPDTPIAIMLSKADLLKYFTRPDAYHFMTNPRYGETVNLQDVEIIDNEVKRLLENYGEDALVKVASRYRRVKFFATSATGEPPDAAGHFTKVEPCRCLDPMLWILNQLGIVKAGS